MPFSGLFDPEETARMMLSPEAANIPMPHIPQQAAMDMLLPSNPPIQPMGDMGTVVNPAPSWLPQKTPPATAEEYEQRKSKWTEVLNRIQENPNMKQILLTVGTRLMQGRRPGQSTLGGIAEAIQLGMLHDAFLDANTAAQANKEREFKMKEAESAARVEESKTNIERSRQQIEQGNQKFPMELQKLELDSKVATLNAKIAEMNFKVAEAQDRGDPAGEKRAKLELRKLEAELARVQAAAAASYAQAKETNQRARGLEDENNARAILANPNSTPEQKEAARAMLTAKTSAGGTRSAQVEMVNAFKENYLQMNPNASEQELAKAVNDFITRRAKQDRITELQKYVENGILTAKEVRAILEAEGLLPTVEPKGKLKPVSEADIQATMRANGLTREEVLKRLKAKGYAVPEK